MHQFTLWRVIPALLLLALLSTAGPGCTKQSQKSRHLVRGDRALQAEQYDKAEIEYLIALKAAPHEREAISKLGTLYHTEGKFLRAHTFLQKAVELQPERNDLRLKLCQTYVYFHKLDAAREHALRVLQEQPAQEEALLALIDSSTNTHQLQEARQRIEGLPSPARNGAGYHVGLGMVFVRQGELNQAETEFKQALVLNPRSSTAHLALGKLFLLRNDPKQAEPALKAAAEFAPLRSTTRLNYAEFQLRTGAVQEARKIVEEITKKAPDYIPAWIFAAQIALAEQKHADCAALIEKVLARDPGSYDALMLHGDLMLAKGDGTNAVARFDKVISLYGPVPLAQHKLALAHLLNGNVLKATVCLNQAIAVDPNFVDAILLLAELNLRRGEPAPAVAALTQLLSGRPQLVQAHLLLAGAYLAQKNFEAATAVYRGMMTQFPQNAQVPWLLGLALAQQDKKEEARQAFEKSLELSPDYLPAAEQLVNLDLLDKQYATATERVQKQIQKKPGAAEPWLLLGKIHWAKGEMAQTEEALIKAIELDPNLRAAYLLLAQVYLASNQQQLALERLTTLVAKNTNDLAAFMQIGIIQDQLNNYEAARKAYERVLALNPRFGPALNNLAFLFSERLEQPKRAYELAHRARELLPTDPFAADTLGWILYRQGEYARALSLLRESAAKLPTEPEVQFHLGMTHYMLGETEPARLALQRALQENKDFPGKEEARQRLALLAIEATTANASILPALEQKLQREPTDPVLLGLIAALYERDSAFDRAAQTYERALKQNPRNVQLMLKLAQIYSTRLNNPSKALAMAKAAHNLAPEDARVSHALGRLVFQSGDFGWASSLLTESARNLPNELEVLYDLAWSSYSLGRVAEAEATMQTVSQAGPSFAKAEEANRFLALLVAAKSPAQAQQAASQAQQILTAQPNYVPALVVCAVVQQQHGDYSQAIQSCERILAHYPLFAPAARDLAILCFEHLGDDKRAYDLAVKARESFPQDSDLTKVLGVLAYRRGDYARAVQLLNECRPQRNTDADLLYYLGMSHYRLKDPAKSKAALQRALELNLPTKLADDARRVLVTLK